MRARTSGLLLSALLAAGAQAQQDNAAQPLQRRLDAARAAADARFESESAACRQRFAVNACIDTARQRRRQAVVSLQAEQRALDEADRRQRAADRQAEVTRKQAEVARRDAASAPAPAASAADAPIGPRPRAAASPRADASDAAAKAAVRAEAARQRQAEIQADQARIQARMAKRAAQGKQPLPLPPVPGASAPR